MISLLYVASQIAPWGQIKIPKGGVCSDATEDPYLEHSVNRS